MATFVCAAAGPCAGIEHLRLRSQFSTGAGCCKRRMLIYAQSKFDFLIPAKTPQSLHHMCRQLFLSFPAFEPEGLEVPQLPPAASAAQADSLRLWS